MDPKKRRALIDEQSVAGKFEVNFTEENRRWFVDRVIKIYEGQGLSDAVIITKVEGDITAAKTLVTAQRDFALALTADGNSRYSSKAMKGMRRHRVEILYGAIATNPEFAVAANKNYLLFVAKRRFRQVCRTFLWVNSNKQGYFRYPHRCASNQRWRVNEDAAPFWEEITPPWSSNFSPSQMKKQGGGLLDPVQSIAKLFVKKTDACKGNLYDCGTVGDIVYMDSLAEAKTPATFLNKLASLGTHYFAIVRLDRQEDPNRQQFTFFMNDASSQGVMRRVRMPMPPLDLQVGDHVYIYNHPLYKIFRPEGSWRGEHAFVYACGNRDYRSAKGFVFGGHGKEGTLYQFYYDFVTELTSYLALARSIAMGHLTYMIGGAAAILPGTANEVEDAVTINGSTSIYRIIEYDQMAISGRDFTKIPSKAKRKPKTFQPGFLVLQSKTANEFYLVFKDKLSEDKRLRENLMKRIADLPVPKKPNHVIKFKRISAPAVGAPPAEIYSMTEWGVAYTERNTGVERLWAFFEIKDGKVRRHELKTDKDALDPQLLDAPFSLFTSASTDIDVILPTVDFGAHKTFLAANGAI
jgi:hypothetical protein